MTRVAENALTGIVDLSAYPIDRLESAQGQELVASCRRQLADDGCVVLRKFVPQASLARLASETERLAPGAHLNDTRTNPYNSPGDPSLPETHPRNRFGDRSNAFVAGDLIDTDTIVRQIYHDRAFKRFIATIVGEETIYDFADPLADLVINVLNPGCQHPWHFDSNDFIVTMLTRQPEAGGTFDYAANIRNAESENYEAAQAVLEGDHARVTSIPLELGDLQVFFGRNSLHRVSRVEGSKQRHTVIFAYSDRPGVVGSPYRAKTIFGRMAPIHERMLAEENPATETASGNG